jgi:hypothetical protein
MDEKRGPGRPPNNPNNPQNAPRNQPNADEPGHRNINPEPRRDEPQQPHTNEPGTPGRQNPDAPPKGDEEKKEAPRGFLQGMIGTSTVTKEDKPVKKIPVMLKRGYFPKDPDHPRNPATGDPMKVERGTTMRLPVDEVKELLGKGIAERADDLPA